MYAINSCGVFAGTDGCTIRMFGEVVMKMTGRKSLVGVVGQLGCEMRQDRLRAVKAHVERVAVGRRFRRRIGADR